MAGRIGLPKGAHVLYTSEPADGALHGKRDFADGMALRIWQGKEYLGVGSVSSRERRSSGEEDRRVRVRERFAMREAEVGEAAGA